MMKFKLLILIASALTLFAACKESSTTRPHQNSAAQNKPLPRAEGTSMTELEEEKKRIEANLNFLSRYKLVIDGIPPSNDAKAIAEKFKMFVEIKNQAIHRIAKNMGSHSEGCKRFSENYAGILDDFEHYFKEMATVKLSARDKLLVEARMLTGLSLFNPMVGLIGNNAEGGVDIFDEDKRETCVSENREEWLAENIVLRATIQDLNRMLFGIKGYDSEIHQSEVVDILLKARQADDFRNEIYFTLVFIPPSLIFWQISATRGLAFLTRTFSGLAARPAIAETIAHIAPLIPESLAFHYLHKSIFDVDVKTFPKYFLAQWDRSMDLVQHFVRNDLDSPDIYLYLLNAGMGKVDEAYNNFLAIYESHINDVLTLYGSVDAAIQYQYNSLIDVNEKITALEKQ